MVKKQNEDNTWLNKVGITFTNIGDHDKEDEETTLSTKDEK